MMSDECDLARLLLQSESRGERIKPRDAVGSLGMHPKRARYLLLKWAGKGYYDYGVSYDLGWLTPDGKTYLKEWA